jgi:hypothetical protein
MVFLNVLWFGLRAGGSGGDVCACVCGCVFSVCGWVCGCACIRNIYFKLFSSLPNIYAKLPVKGDSTSDKIVNKTILPTNKQLKR